MVCVSDELGGDKKIDVLFLGMGRYCAMGHPHQPVDHIYIDKKIQISPPAPPPNTPTDKNEDDTTDKLV